MKALRLPLLLFAVPALLVAALPSLADILVYRRDALAHGELWRLWTGHWVHFSPSHLAWNLAVVLVAGTALERLRPGLLLRHTLPTAPLISLALYALEPAMHTYGGLSGLATGLVVLLGLQLRSTRADPVLGNVLVALVALKLGYEALGPRPLVVSFSSAGIRSAPLAHFAGAGLALIHHLGLLLLRAHKGSSIAPVRPSSAAHAR